MHVIRETVHQSSTSVCACVLGPRLYTNTAGGKETTNTLQTGKHVVDDLHRRRYALNTKISCTNATPVVCVFN